MLYHGNITYLESNLFSFSLRFIDKIFEPLEPLRKPLPGISDIAGKDISALTIAEIYVGPAKSGADTVRQAFRVYDGLSELASQFSDTGPLELAKQCDLLAGFTCCGYLQEEECKREPPTFSRLLQEQPEDHFFDNATAIDYPVHSLVQVGSASDRHLSTSSCPNPDRFDVPEYCGDNCNKGTCDHIDICGKCKGIKQKKCRLKCRANGVKGLSFPFLDDPFGSMTTLFQKEDIVSTTLLSRSCVFHNCIYMDTFEGCSVPWCTEFQSSHYLSTL